MECGTHDCVYPLVNRVQYSHFRWEFTRKHTCLGSQLKWSLYQRDSYSNDGGDSPTMYAGGYEDCFVGVNRAVRDCS